MPIAAVVAVAAVVFTIYWPTFLAMVAVWSRSQTFAHGFLILPIAAWLLFRQRHELAAIPPAMSWRGVVALLGCLLSWVVGTLVHADVLSQAAMMAMIPSTLLLILGPAAVRAVAFVLLFSMLAVPAGEFLIQPMMDLTADGSVFLLKISGIPVFQDGWLISIPVGNFQVADACSGVRYLIGAATTAALFAYLFFRSNIKRCFFIGFVIVLTVVANVVRAYIIILLAYLTEMRLAVGVDHFIYGWFLFSLLMVVVFTVGLRFADAPLRRTSPVAAAGPQPFTAAIRAGALRHAVAAILAAGLLLTGPWAGDRLSGRRAPSSLMPVPEQIGAAQAVKSIPAPQWLKPMDGWDARHLAFRGGVTPFELHVFRGGFGPAGRDLTSLREQLAGEAITLVADKMVSVPAPDGGALQLREMRLQHDGRDLMVAYWFTVGPAGTANPFTAKLMEIRTIFAGEHIKQIMIAVAIDTDRLSQPGASLHAIAAEVTASMSACLNSGLRESRQCQATGAVAQ